MHIAPFSLLDDRGMAAETEKGDEETDNMKASLDSSGFNLSQKAYPQTQINDSRCECHTRGTVGNEKEASSIRSHAACSCHPETPTATLGNSVNSDVRCLNWVRNLIQCDSCDANRAVGVSSQRATRFSTESLFF